MIRKPMHPLICYVLGWGPIRVTLTEDRLTKTLYLIDWEHAQSFGCQATSISWQFGEYGPTTPDVIETLREFPEDFKLTEVPTILSTRKFLVEYRGSRERGEIDVVTKRSIDTVMSSVADLEWGTFISVVYNTLPMSTQPKFGGLDLVGLANKFRTITA